MSIDLDEIIKTNLLKAGKKPAEILARDRSLNKEAVILAKPDYSRAARDERISGAVDISVVVDEEGVPLSAGFLSGHRSLLIGARNGACRSRFKPAIVSGVPVKASGILTYRFVAP